VTRLTLAAPRLLRPGGTWTGPAAITVADGRIEQLHETPPPGAERLPSGALTPGLLDIHNNGAFGVDFATADPAAWRRVLTELARRGVTAVQPTVITAPLPDLLDAMERVDAAMADARGARILGAHLEGPFLAPNRRGAHRADWVQPPTDAALDILLNHPATRRVLRTVTLAPELDGGIAAVRRFRDAGIIVSVGHSDATAAQTIAAADAGATMVTHLFNAMSPLSHRAPGVPGAALTDARLWCCLIVDGAHVDPIACRLVFQAAPGRVIAVTDSIVAAGLPPGTTSEFGGAPIVVDATGLCRRLDGTISGAGIVLDEGVRRMIALGIDPATVLHAATTSPATALGRDDLGRLQPGACADLVWWDDDWVPRRVWIGGEEVAVAG
jgi:N-acetylglucosamine-6-phosphate deacetylase